jgi:L-fuconolactonase
MLIIDSQVHFFGPEAGANPSLKNHRKRDIPELLDHMNGAGVSRVVLVPARPDDSATNAAALHAAASAPTRFAVIGKLNPSLGGFDSVLRDWKEPRLLGYRVSFPPGRLTVSDPAHDNLWKAAESKHVPLMVWAPGQLADLAAVAARHPDLRLTIDHLGLGAGDFDEAVDPIARELASHAGITNLSVKASGLPGHSTHAFPYSNLHGAVLRVIEAYGPQRVFWGTDLSTLPCPYLEAVQMFSEHMGLPQEALQQVLGLGIASWLGWPPA